MRVSTHSRPKAAAEQKTDFDIYENVSTHSRPKAAAERFLKRAEALLVSTHSRPKAAEPLLKALFHQVSQPRFR